MVVMHHVDFPLEFEEQEEEEYRPRRLRQDLHCRTLWIMDILWRLTPSSAGPPLHGRVASYRVIPSSGPALKNRRGSGCFFRENC